MLSDIFMSTENQDGVLRVLKNATNIRTQVAGACEYGFELSDSIKCGEFIYYLQNQLAFQEGLCSME